MEILVTGAAGRIGRHVVEDLREEHRVIATSRHSERYTGVPNVTYDSDNSHPTGRGFGSSIEALNPDSARSLIVESP